MPFIVPTAVPVCHAAQLGQGSYWIRVEWQAPDGNGGAPIESYRIQIRRFWAIYYSITVPATAFDHYLSVADYGSFGVRVWAVNAAGSGPSCNVSVLVNS